MTGPNQESEKPAQHSEVPAVPEDAGSALLSNTVLEPHTGPSDSEPSEAPTPAGQPAVEKSPSSALSRVGRYEIRSILGQGTFGTVYLAFDETLRRLVAIKAPRLDISDKAIEQEFLIEARQLAQLRHPGIVGVLDVVSSDGRCYIVSDFVDGVSLSRWLKSTRPDWRTSVLICAQIADALAHAHQQRTVHRDLKPANVILTANLQPVIVDFGLAVSDAQRAYGTERGDVSGTPQYMSPEQASGVGHRIDGRTDIYSLGVILYRMLTGRLPFESPDPRELLRQVQEDEPQPPRQLLRDLPQELERIVLKALTKSLRERYTTAADMAVDLRALVNVSPSPQNVDEGSITIVGPKPGPVVPLAGHSPRPAPQLPDTGRAPAARVPGPTGMPVRGNSDEKSDREHSNSSLSSSRRSTGSQRRQVTIVSCGCDVFENEQIQELLDSEEQAALLQTFQKFCRTIAVEYSGAVLNDTDDGVAVCFGFPRAFEDSVIQAARFALTILQRCSEAVSTFSSRRLPLSARVVMHTDVAVVENQIQNEDSVSTVSVVGAIRNFTSRLEPVAELGCLLASEQSHRLLRGAFESESIGAIRIKGLSSPVTLYRIQRQRQSASRVELAEESGLTPLVGREREVGLLQERWEQAVEGMGQVVLIIGEAGLGKSRLIHALKHHVLESNTGHGDPIVEWRSSQQRQSSSLFPVIDCFERILGFDREESSGSQLDKLVEYLRGLNLDGDHEIGLMAALLSIPLSGRYPALDLPPQVQHEQTTALLLDWLKELADRQPLLFVIEDLHWVDPSTLAFVEQLVDRGLADRILTLLTFRPEFETPWKSKAHQTNLALNRLTRRQIQELMEKKARRRLPTSLVEQIVERTDGVPLFVEEYTQMLVESQSLQSSGDSSVSGIQAIKQIPASLQDMLMSRLDRIDCDLSVVQLGATIGRGFTWELIRASSSLDEPTLQAELEKLVRAELLVLHGRAPRHRYQFKHALLQDAAYSSLVKARRQEYHGRIAEALEASFPDVCEKEPEVLAQHFMEASQWEKAAEFWKRAGERSLKRYAYREAIQQLRSGLESLKELPETRDRHQREIELHVMLGVPLQSIVGYSAPAVEENYARAFALCQELQLSTEQFPILYGLFRYYMLQARYARAQEIAEQLVVMAEETQEEDFLVAAHRAIAGPLVYRGEYATAMPHLDKVLAIPASAEVRSRVNRYDVVDPWIAAGSYRSWALWLTGYPQQALEQSEKTLREAESLKHPFTVTLALSFSTWLHQFHRDIERTLAAASRALELAEEHGFQFWVGWGKVLKHWALGISGQDSSACESIRQGIVAWRAQGSELGAAYFYGMQAEVALVQGRPNEALAALTQADDFARSSGEGFPVPDLFRLRGLAMEQSDEAVAESFYRKAMEHARSQNSRSLELRAAVQLARLLTRTGRNDEAKTLLSEGIERFPEGQSTRDLSAAKELLKG
ncbi:MAG: protein kinase [Planctomycetaceae bacterium]|nr:protein kinase [Planctomycetaceae bacterium]